jgi:hypothetical protein
MPNVPLRWTTSPTRGGSNFLTTALNVATPTPTFAWAFGGPGTQTRYQVQMSTESDLSPNAWPEPVNVTVVSANTSVALRRPS